MKTNHTAALLAVPLAAVLAACSPEAPPAEPLRPVRTVELRYNGTRDVNRYTGTVRARHEVEEAFRVGGKVLQRKVDVGQTVHEGDILAVIDDTDYRLTLDATQQQAASAVSQAKQAESDRKRLEALRTDGSVSDADEERARTTAQTTAASAVAEARKLELARNRLKYAVLRATRSGVVTAVRFEAGQVVAEGQPVMVIAAEGAPEIVVDIPEDHLAAFRKATFKATLASAPDAAFDVVLRELAPQAAAQTRTYQARLKPASAQRLPLGATATLTSERAAAGTPVAAVPAAAITQNGGKPAVWVVRTKADAPATVELVPVTVHGYLNDEVLLSGPRAGEHVVTAGVQKMAPGLQVMLPGAAAATADKLATSKVASK
jgi:RND family efflux transporter MFP subunit